MPQIEGFDDSLRKKTVCRNCTAILTFTESEVVITT